MNMFRKAQDLFLEAVDSHNYVKLPIVPRVLLGIFVMFPCWVLSILFFALYCVFAFFVAIADYPAETLLNFIRKEGQQMRTPTETIIYLIGFPAVFFFKVFIAFGTIWNFLLYFLMNATFYGATLGGTTFSPFLNEEVERKVKGASPKEEEKPEEEAAPEAE